MSYLVELQRRPRCPTHPLVDNGYEVADFACPLHVNLADTVKRLLRRVEVLEEDHDRPRRDVRLTALSVGITDSLHHQSYLRGVRDDV